MLLKFSALYEKPFFLLILLVSQGYSQIKTHQISEYTHELSSYPTQWMFKNVSFLCECKIWTKTAFLGTIEHKTIQAWANAHYQNCHCGMLIMLKTAWIFLKTFCELLKPYMRTWKFLLPEHYPSFSLLHHLWYYSSF